MGCCTGLFKNAGSEEGKITAGRGLLTVQAWDPQKWMAKSYPPYDPIEKMSSPAQLFPLDPEQHCGIIDGEIHGNPSALEAELEALFNPGIAVACWNLQETEGLWRCLILHCGSEEMWQFALGMLSGIFFYILEKHFAWRCEFQIVH